jgi:hypothetical protein
MDQTYSVFARYVALEYAQSCASRPRCVGYFEFQPTGCIGIVFTVVNSYQLSLDDLILYKPKPSGDDRRRLATAVIDCVRSSWDDGDVPLNLWTRSIKFCGTLPVQSEKLDKKPVLSDLAPLITPMIRRQRLLYIPYRRWEMSDPFCEGSKEERNRSTMWTLGVILTEVATWTTFAATLKTEGGDSTEKLAGRVADFVASFDAPGSLFKGDLLTHNVIKKCFAMNGQGESVPMKCTQLLNMLAS